MKVLTGFSGGCYGGLTPSTGWDDDCSRRRLARTVESALADEVAAAARAHGSGVHGICGNVAALACAIRFRFAGHAEDHFPAEDNVRRLHTVRVIRIARVLYVLPGVDVREAFAAEFGGEDRFVHREILTRQAPA
jgi:hypothetical protein